MLIFLVIVPLISFSYFSPKTSPPSPLLKYCQCPQVLSWLISLLGLFILLGNPVVVSGTISALMTSKFIFQPLVNCRFKQKASLIVHFQTLSSLCLKPKYFLPSLPFSHVSVLVVPPFVQPFRLFLKSYLWILHLPQPRSVTYHQMLLILHLCQFLSVITGSNHANCFPPAFTVVFLKSSSVPLRLSNPKCK